MPPHRIFLLSPAHCGGKRAELLLNKRAVFPLAVRLRSPPGIALGEAFTFLSGLYFRGKLAYADRFARPPHGEPGAQIITTDRGLLPADAMVTARDLEEFGGIDIKSNQPRYRAPLERDLARIRRQGDVDLVLLGSIATGKYLDVLAEIVGDRLLFPTDFVGRGDMSRGALLLQAVRNGMELSYQSATGTVRRGARAPKVRADPRPLR
jgi:hypothetical protein